MRIITALSVTARSVTARSLFYDYASQRHHHTSITITTHRERLYLAMRHFIFLPVDPGKRAS